MSEQETEQAGGEQPKTTAERLAVAEARASAAEKHRAHLRRIAVAEQEIPRVWATGEVKKTDLAATYGVSTMTVGRILAKAGYEQQRIRRLTDEERKEIHTYLVNGTTKEEIAQAYGISVNAVRSVGLKSGALSPGERKPQRSDADYEAIAELDALAIQRFGSGLYNLGVGLRTWLKKKQDVAAADERASGAGGIPPEEGPTAEAPTQGVPTEAPVASPEPPHTEADPNPGYPVSETPATPLEQAAVEGDDNFRF